MVHVEAVGQFQNVGHYSVPANSTVYDVVKKAGGFTPYAMVHGSKDTVFIILKRGGRESKEFRRGGRFHKIYKRDWNSRSVPPLPFQEGDELSIAIDFT